MKKLLKTDGEMYGRTDDEHIVITKAALGIMCSVT